jgi:hypothetical protein
MTIQALIIVQINRDKIISKNLMDKGQEIKMDKIMDGDNKMMRRADKIKV